MVAVARQPGDAGRVRGAVEGITVTDPRRGFEPAAVVARLEATMRAGASPERALKERAYLRSELEHLGAGVPAVRKAVRDAEKAAGRWVRAEVLAIVKALWASRVHELRLAAVELLGLASDRLEPTDLPLLERLLRDCRTWALVDPLALGAVARLVEREPDLASRLDRWAADEDFWVRRSALLALLPPLRRGDGDFGRFARYADAMLDEREFFIRKAIGWVLRDTGKRRPELVADWLTPRAHRLSGVTIREAVKPLPEARRDALLGASRRVR